MLISLLFLYSILKVLLLIFLCFPLGSKAQLVINDVFSIDTAPLVFNAAQVHEKKIRAIKGRVSIKKPKGPIEKTNLYTAYFFDSLGRISNSYEMDSRKDTTFHRYFYNDRGQLIYQSIEYRRAFSYETYLWDQNAQISAIEYFERVVDGAGRTSIKKTKQRNFESSFTDSTENKLIKNEYGTPFMTEVTFLDEKGTIDHIEKRFIATSEGTIEELAYDEDGNIIEKKTLTSKQKIEKENFQFSYDKLGNLKMKKYFEAGRLIYERQYIVNEKNGLLSAILEQKEGESVLKIVQFDSYEYYD